MIERRTALVRSEMMVASKGGIGCISAAARLGLGEVAA